MTVKAIFRWKNPDSTADLNLRQANLVLRGVLWGGDISPSTSLKVNVSPFVAHSLDGMTVLEDANQELNVYAGQVNVVVFKAQYNAGGSPTQPTLTWHVYEESVYNARPDKDYLIVFGKVTLAGGATAVTNNDIDMADRDEVTPVGRDPFRGQVATPGALPLSSPNKNKEGDFYYVFSTNTFHFWDGSAWTAQTTGAYTNEVINMSGTLVTSDRDRIVEGSGVISGVRPSEGGDYASNPDVALVEDPNLDSQIGVNTFSALVNGLFAETYARMVQLNPKGDRYDLIFLEVWREEVTDPQNFDYLRNPDGSTHYDIDGVRAKLFQTSWQEGISGDNFDLNEINTDNHTAVVTRWRLAHATGVSSVALYDPCDATVTALGTNIDGNAFTPLGPTGMDQRLWESPAVTTGYDDRSWAIPLFVVRRTSTEDHTIGNGILEFRDNVRYIFPVYPVCDVAGASRKLLKKNHREEPAPFGIDDYPYDEPSGFLTGMDRPLGPGLAANSWRLFNEAIKVRVRGIEDWVKFPNLAEVLNSPPGAGYARELVYLKMNITLYANRYNHVNYAISDKHRPFIPADLAGSIQSMGWKQGYVQWSLVVENLGTTTVLDEDDAMLASGWQRGDVTLSGISKQYEDGGIYSRAVAIDVDNRIHPYLAEWAIPIFLIHRRNTAPWTNTNRNGVGTSRPDGLQDATIISPDDLVDLRHLVGITEMDMGGLLESSVDRLCKGSLRTRMATPWVGPGTGTNEVAGSRILQTDFIGNSGSTNHQMTTGDDVRKIWSDAKEYVPVCVSFDMTLDYNDPRGVLNYIAATGSLTITAPVGAHIVRHLPPLCLAVADDANPEYLNYFHQPLFSSQENFTLGSPGNYAYPHPSSLKVINGGVEVPPPLSGGTHLRFSTNSYDSLDRLASAGGGIFDPGAVNPGDIAVISFWVHYDRTQVSTSPYVANFGLSEIPDEVHAVTQGPLTGTPVPMHLGTPYVTLRANVGATNNFSFSRAQVKAASGYTTVPDGDFEILGIDIDNVTYYPAPTGLTIAAGNIQLTLAKDSISVLLSGVYSGVVEAVVFYRIVSPSAPTNWVEIGRGGKSVRASFEWHVEEIDFGVAAPTGPYAFSLGESHWQHAEVAGRFTPMPLAWTKANPGDPWEVVTPDTTDATFGYPHSNLMSVSTFTATTVKQYLMLAFPKQTALGLGASQHVQIDYTYTPYQGLSKTGGTPFDPADMPALRDKLHGVVEANTDFMATQSGPTSYYGGLDSYGGTPARIPSQPLALYNAKFAEYNQTQLVRPVPATGVTDWSANSRGKSSLNAGAVMRLPFPANPNMVGFDIGGAIDYHSGTMEWDLDPGNEGSSAGFFSFAPGYPSLLTTVDASNFPDDKVRYDQFVNGLTPLAVPGEVSEEDKSFFLAASSETLVSSVGSVNLDIFDPLLPIQNRWSIPPSATAKLDALLPSKKGSVIGRTMSRISGLFGGDINTYGHRFLDGGPTGVSYLSGAVIAAPSWDLDWTSPVLLVSAQEMYICTFPGMPMAYWQLKRQGNGVTLWKDFVVSAAGSARYSCSTLVTSARMRGNYNPSVRKSDRPQLMEAAYDLVRIPMQSGGTNGPAPRTNQGSGETNLKGRSINYPEDWSPTTISNLEAAVVGSRNFYSYYGRGVYLGNPKYRFNMPVLVPGSGTPLDEVSETYNPPASLSVGRTLMADFPDATDQPPETFPVNPATPMFASCPRRNVRKAFGGPLAYVFYGMLIAPSSDQYKNRAVMQITGGPVLGDMNDITNFTLSRNPDLSPQDNPNQVNGTALDAFWPIGRPIMKSK